MKENAELIVIGLYFSCGEERLVKFGVQFINCLALKIWLCPIRHIHRQKISIYRTGKISPVCMLTSKCI